MRDLLWHPTVLRLCELGAWWCQLVSSHGHHPGHGIF